MHWVLFAGLIVAVVIACVRIPKVGLPVLALLIGATLFLLIRSKGEVEKASGLIKPEEIQLDHMEFKQGYGGSYNVNGRIHNKSTEYTLTELTLQIVMSDCVDQQQSGECEVVGETTMRIITHIPSNQARDFKDNVYFEKVQPRGQLTWEYHVFSSQAD